MIRLSLIHIFKLAAAEAREAAPKKRALRETLAAVRAKTEEAREAAKRASEIAKLLSLIHI